MESFGAYLRSARRAAGLSQRELAARCAIDVSYVSKLENDRLPHTPSARTLTLLAAALEVDELDLFRRAGKLVGPLAGLSAQPQALEVMRVAVERIEDPDGWNALLRYIQSDAFADALAHPSTGGSTA